MSCATAGGEPPAQVLEWIEAVGAAGFDQAIEDGAALASLGFHNDGSE